MSRHAPRAPDACHGASRGRLSRRSRWPRRVRPRPRRGSGHQPVMSRCPVEVMNGPVSGSKVKPVRCMQGTVEVGMRPSRRFRQRPAPREPRSDRRGERAPRPMRVSRGDARGGKDLRFAISGDEDVPALGGGARVRPSSRSPMVQDRAVPRPARASRPWSWRRKS